MLKCLFCTSEAMPFAVSGGLGNVSCALAHSLRQRLIGCRIAMPLYGGISQDLKDSMKFLTNFQVPVAWRSQYCGVFEARYDGIIYYLIDNEYYFKREKLYGYLDDAERFSFLSRAILEMLPHIKFQPEIIHCNDWQTALTVVYFDLFYSKKEFYTSMKTIFTIHNIEYQGKYGMEVLEDVVGVSKRESCVLEFDKHINFMKGAIETASRVTTVSPTYAQEILNPMYSYGLDLILKKQAWKLSGILNGININDYNSENDKYIYENFSLDNVTIKIKNKRKLQQRLKLKENTNIPLVGMVTRMVKHKGLDLLVSGLEPLLKETNIQFVILGSGDANYEKFFRLMQERYPRQASVCYGFIPELAHKIYAASDMFLMPSKTEPCGLSQMIAMRYGSIPIVRKTGGLKDTVANSSGGKGNGFIFTKYDERCMKDAVKCALREYQDKHGWKGLVKRAMKSDNSWNKSANEYIRLYRDVIKGR